MALWEAKVLDGDKILGHAIGEVSKDGDVGELVRQAMADFRRKNPDRSLLADEDEPALNVSINPAKG